MKVTIGFIPYLNMVPFHDSFGPKAIQANGHDFVFSTYSPRGLGIEAGEGRVDAGAMSWVDFQRLSPEFETLEPYGIGVHRDAKSVLLFSKQPFADVHGDCAVTDDTSTSFQLLKVLFDRREKNEVRYHRIGSLQMYDGSSDSLLLIGDEALQAGREGVKGFSHKTDLAAEWYRWQHMPFAFARWAVRKSLPADVKSWISERLNQSLNRWAEHASVRAAEEGKKRNLPADLVQDYWDGFAYRMTADHAVSMQRFEELSSQCSNA